MFKSIKARTAAGPDSKLGPMRLTVAGGEMFKSFKARAAAGLVVVLSAGMLLGASPASAASNAANTKACQKGGWKTLQTASGETFKSQGACTSFAAAGGQFGAQCLDSTTDGNADLLLSVPLGEFGNAPGYFSTDGTCSDGIYHVFSILAAPDLATAATACVSLGVIVLFPNLSAQGYPVPSDWWACT